MTQIIAVTKAGENALTATSPNDFIFHSAYNTFKILVEGLLTNQTISANPTTITVAHGQSVIPFVFAFLKYPDGYVATSGSWDYSFNSTRIWFIEVDGTNMYFIVGGGDVGSFNVNIKYYIVEAPAN